MQAGRLHDKQLFFCLPMYKHYSYCVELECWSVVRCGLRARRCGILHHEDQAHLSDSS